MKTAEELNKVDSFDEIVDLHLFDVAPHAHIIVGTGGKCMCGVYGRKTFTCQQILAMKSHEMQSAMLADGLNDIAK